METKHWLGALFGASVLVSQAAQAAEQIITPTPAVQTLEVGDTATIAVDYRTDNGGKATGLGLAIHYNSSQLDCAGGVQDVLQESLLQPPGDSAEPDAADLDGDPSTDVLIRMAWVSFAGVNWPSAAQPTALFNLDCQVLSGWTGDSKLNFSGDPAAGFTLASTSATVSLPVTHALEVSRTGNGTGVVSSNDGAINCGDQCGSSYPEGTSVTLNAAADAGSLFDGWTGCDSSNGTTCTVAMSQQRSVSASFVLPAMHTLNVSKSGGGSGSITSNGGGINCGSTCSSDFVEGSSVTLTAAAAAGSLFDGWTGCDSSSGTSCTVAMNQQRNVSVSFVLPVRHTLSVLKAGNGSGSVTSSGGEISCGDQCSHDFVEGSSVTLTAVADAGSLFASWLGCGSVNGASCTVSMSQQQQITASFDIDPGVLQVSEGDWTQSVTVGAPLVGVSNSYTLDNSGGRSLNFTVSANQAWLDVQPAGGTLAAGANANIAIVLNAAAEQLGVGEHIAELTFANTSGGQGDSTRTVRLSIDALPIAAAPTFTPADGHADYQAFTVTVSSASQAAQLRYTLDGSEPTETHGTSLANGGSVTISESGQLKAVAHAPNQLAVSAVSSASYVVDSNLDSDGDGMPDAWEVEHGLNRNDPADAAQDADGDGLSNLEEFQQNSDPRADSTPPTIVPPSNVSVDASGYLTAVNLTPPQVSDLVDPNPSVTVDKSGPFRPGRHTLVWTATDSAGNSAVAPQLVDIRPQVNFAPDTRVSEGAQGKVQLLLNGEAPTYPVRVTYTVAGTAEPGSDHNAASGELEIGESGRGEINISTVADGVVEGDETVIFAINTAQQAAIGAYPQVTLTITEGNLPPQVWMDVSQAGRSGGTITRDGGNVSITTTVTDPNPNDSHSHDWSASGRLLDAALPGFPNQGNLMLDPSLLGVGVQAAQVQVSDGLASVSAQRFLRVLDSAPQLGSGDSDGDGIADDAEGAGDSDGDGVPDYLDPLESAQYLQAGDGRTLPLQVRSGVDLRIGAAALTAGRKGAVLAMSDLAAAYPDAQIALPNELTFTDGLFDFEIAGVDLAGDGLAQVVLPLAQAVPENAQYWKFTERAGWSQFVEVGGADALASAPRSGDSCPPVGDDSYRAGLNAGDLCLLVTLQDGGPNDADGVRDGVIRDPAALVNKTSTPSSDGGGGGGSVLWLLLLLSGGLGFTGLRRTSFA